MCMSIGRAPKSSPPGIDSVHLAAAGEQRAEHVDRGADPLGQLVRRDGHQLGRRSSAPADPGRARSHVTPIAASSSPMIDTSTRSGTLASSYTPSASRLAAISLSAEFLAPGTSIRPDSGPGARRTTIRPRRWRRISHRRTIVRAELAWPSDGAL